jgi:hypothetical protein
MRPTIEHLWNHPLFQNLKELSKRTNSAPLKSTKELLIENGICFEKNIHEISEFYRYCLDQNSAYSGQRNIFESFKHIFLIQNDFGDVNKIPKFNSDETVSILVSTSIYTIPHDYFCYFWMLETFHIFANIEILGDKCFYECEKLKEVFFPGTLKKIGKICFFNCRKLSKTNFPKTVIKTGENCFCQTNLFLKKGKLI